MKKKINIKFNYTFVLLGLLALVLFVFSVTKFSMLWRVSIWRSMTVQFPEYGVMTLGVMLCFIIGCIDVSFVALGNFATIMSFVFVSRVLALPEEQAGTTVIIAIILALSLGALSGFLNGNLISRLGIPPIIATLSTQMLFMGLTIAFTRGDAIRGIPPIFSELGRKTLFGLISVPLLVFIMVFLFCAFLLKYTTYGKKLYMIGSNPKAARFSAVDTTWIINATFVLNGIIATIGTLLMVANMNSARASYGASYLMRCILILVLAGVLPSGGMGKIINVLISIITIQIIASGVNLFHQLNAFYGSMISAVLLLVVLVATSYMVGERKSRKTDDIEAEDKEPSSA